MAAYQPLNALSAVLAVSLAAKSVKAQENSKRVRVTWLPIDSRMLSQLLVLAALLAARTSKKCSTDSALISSTQNKLWSICTLGNLQLAASRACSKLDIGPFAPRTIYNWHLHLGQSTTGICTLGNLQLAASQACCKHTHTHTQPQPQYAHTRNRNRNMHTHATAIRTHKHTNTHTVK